MPTSDTYGFKGQSLEKARDYIEVALGIKFKLHDSSYLGGDYYRSGTQTGEHYILRRNWDIVQNEVEYEEYMEYPVLLQVEDTERSLDIQAKLCTDETKCVHLSRRNC